MIWQNRTAGSLMTGLVLMYATSAIAENMADRENDPKKGCSFVATSNLVVSIFEDGKNGDEGDFIGGFRLKKGEKSSIVIPARRDGAIYYMYKFENRSRWFGNNRTNCAQGREIAVP